MSTNSVPIVESRNETAQAVAAMWEELLQHAPIGAADNFFDLGGDSMIMMMMIFRVREQLGVEIPQHMLFDAPTFGDFSNFIEGQLAMRNGTSDTETL